MLKTLKAALARSALRDRERRDYLGLLRLGPHLVRDTGIARSEIHDRLDALGVPK
ncbi:MAG: hypothetical protein U1E34_06685 [Amaricoccus sp.]